LTVDLVSIVTDNDPSHGSSVRQVGRALDVASRDPTTGKRDINERMAS
jgi:hypothetical protein